MSSSIVGIASKTLASILEEFAVRAFDTEETASAETRAKFVAWAKELVCEADRRDFPGLLKDFVAHRKLEQDYVNVHVRDVRALVWVFAALASRELTEEREADAKLTVQLDVLRRAVSGTSNESLKSEAQATLDLFESAAKARRKRQQEAMKRLGQTLKTLRSELDQARRQLSIDPLTELYNRAALDQQIQRIADVSAISGNEATVLMVDIDHFKKINDTYGHAAGDFILKSFARLLQHAFPRRTEFVARYGGEEFTVIFQEDGQDVAVRQGELFLEKLRGQEFRYEGTVLKLTASMGSSLLRHGESPLEWLKRADGALYAAKRHGRDRLVSG